MSVCVHEYVVHACVHVPVYAYMPSCKQLFCLTLITLDHM